MDIKFFNDTSYRRICGGTLEPVLESIKTFYAEGIHLEITTLLIDHYNDGEEEMKGIAGFIASVDKGIPWHISRFFPSYKMLDAAATQRDTIIKAYGIGKEAGLNYVYAGNIQLDGYENTVCPSCGKVLIKRETYRVAENHVTDAGTCGFCGYKIYGVFGP